jgi:hypothetical protein
MSDTAWQEAGSADVGPGAGDDAALIARSLRTPGCFGLLFDRHAPAIGRYVARRLGPDAVDDLVGETFLVAFRRRGHYDLAHGDARPWLYGIGLGYEEAALALEVPTGTVSSRLVRARRKVREALGGQDPTRPGEDAVITRLATSGASEVSWSQSWSRGRTGRTTRGQLSGSILAARPSLVLRFGQCSCDCPSSALRYPA